MTPFTPVDLMRLSINTSIMLVQAQSVIAMRMMGMAGVWTVLPSENSRMVSEKLRAVVMAGAAAQKSALSGGSATQIAEAALAPVHRATAANARRLTRSGPKSLF
ncbi:antifreeze protein [Pseudotabrizicola algicola]|uniref:Antifreeze protein n=1 Tax=Pseudotabrizicola algicola TaxID=2709381 RepID=A0A6B3RRB9_9RHOB|nr:antifreeze protein [Pseudotabrizicola algicola]NEX45639.1 antifreeze protein [Pseudotabrizicola algicola]